MDFRFLLDTNVLSELAKPQPSPKVLNWLTQNVAASAMPSVVLAELWRGVKSADKARRQALEDDLERLEAEMADAVIPFDAAAAREWGAYVTAKGFVKQPKGYADSQIAAIALHRGMTVVTRNEVDFPGVTTLNPF
jgi:predicted nucleic acid-binding protein